MGDGFPSGIAIGALQGFARGQERKEERQYRKELLDYQKKKFTLEEEGQRLENEKLRKIMEAISQVFAQSRMQPANIPEGPYLPNPAEFSLRQSMNPPPAAFEAMQARPTMTGPSEQERKQALAQAFILSGQGQAGANLLFPEPTKENIPSVGTDRESISLELYNKDFSKLGTEERSIVNQIQQARSVEIAGARAGAAATARGQAEEELPLNEKAFFWFDPKTGEHADPNESMRSAKSKGMVPATQAGIDSTGFAKTALAQIKEYRELAPRLLLKRTGNTVKDIGRLKLNQAKIAARAMAGDDDARRLSALFGSITTFARAFGDAANIAVAERNFLRKTVLTSADSLESGLAVLDQAERIIKRNIKAKGLSVPEDFESEIKATPRGQVDLKTKYGLE